MPGVDGGLHFFFGHVDVEREIELQHDDRDAAGAGGGHLAEALHLAELALERGGDGGGHHVGAGAGIEREHLDGRVVDLRQRGDRQLEEGDDADEQNGGHQQRGGDRPQDEWAGWIHGAVVSAVPEVVGSLTLERVTWEPFWSFSKLLLATTSPASMP